jgi:putative phage-type endonuclease
MLINQDFTHDRTKYLGGSDIGAILGLSKYRSPLDVWLEKTGRVVNTVDNLPVRFGTFAEEFVAREYAKATGFSLDHQLDAITHPIHPYLQGHIDRLAFAANLKSGDAPTHLLECKTANPFSRSEWGETGTDEVPMSYLAQCHWYLALSHLERCDLAVLFGNSDFRIYQIEKDPQLEGALIEKAVSFWEHHILADIAPEPQSAMDYQNLFHTEVKGKAIAGTSESLNLVTQFHQLSMEIDEKEEAISQIKASIMAQMGDAEKLTYQDQIVATWKKPKASFRFDSKRFEIEHPDLFPGYQTPIANSRRLVIKEWRNPQETTPSEREISS